MSLGQGQGPLAERTVAEGMRLGTWVVLQNVHLFPSWMPSLETICSRLAADPTKVGPFRLWLTTSASPVFPVTALQQCVKLTKEPPKGVRANLIGTYLGCEGEEYFARVARPAELRKLYFSLAFFHAIIQVGKGGKRGWGWGGMVRGGSEGRRGECLWVLGGGRRREREVREGGE